MEELNTFYAITGIDSIDLLLEEAKSFGFSDAKIQKAGVEFTSSIERAQDFCLNTRLSTRVLMYLNREDKINSEEDFRNASLKINWTKYIDNTKTFFITSYLSSSKWLNNSVHANYVLKDVICDECREQFNGERPNVDKENPDVVFHLYFEEDSVVYYIDFSGRGLSKRGYRKAKSKVYLSELSSFTMLLRSKWDKNTFILDPFCGSGTILIEALLYATGTAPGLLDSNKFAFLKLPQFNKNAWELSLQNAKQKSEEGKKSLREKFGDKPLAIGFDLDKKAVEDSRLNAREAGIDEFVLFLNKDSINKESYQILSEYKTGCIITDMPYNIRSKVEDISHLYSGFSSILTLLFKGWNVSILSLRSEDLENIDLKPERTNTIFNGELKAQLAHYRVFTDEEVEQLKQKKIEARQRMIEEPLSPFAFNEFSNIKKRLEDLKDYLLKNSIDCFRVYNSKDYALDFYSGKYAVVSLYNSNINIDDLKKAIFRALDIEWDDIFIKHRDRQKGKNQYNKISSSSKLIVIKEGGHKFYVNFAQYLDTGIFLDHRNMRAKIEGAAKGKRFLNLFSYTATASVYASLGGASSTVSVDASATYTSWAKENFRLNGITGMGNFFYKSDAIEYLKSLDRNTKFDLIFIDPPTFSNSKMRQVFSVQRDHAFLINCAANHLDDEGVIYFSNNFLDFQMDDSIFKKYNVIETTSQTVPFDFSFSDKPIHRSWEIRKIKKDNVKKLTQKILSFRNLKTPQ